ncbi:MAG: hypothetical protein WBM50_00310, partial [Acidimicrobiales bacterium]
MVTDDLDGVDSGGVRGVGNAGLGTDAAAEQADQLTDSLLLLIDGGFAAARMFGPDNSGGLTAKPTGAWTA